MQQYTIEPPEDPVIGSHRITNPVTVEFGFVGPVIRMRYAFRTCGVDPLEVTGKYIPVASENMLARLVDCYRTSVEGRDADDRHLGKIIAELEGFIEALPNSDGSE